jgi:chloramphenicol-sensitive protein RarD
MDQPHANAPPRYVAYGIAAYAFWGLIPLYFKTVAEVSPVEILAHRAIWSCVVLAVLVRLVGRRDEVRQSLRSPKLAILLTLSATLIGVNWLTFIYTVASGQVLQSSLGYFLSPLASVLLGVVFLHERLWPYQIVAVALAAAGFAVLACLAGTFPWLALILASTAACHALLRKIAPTDGLVSLAVETLVMTPVAIAYLGCTAAAAHLTGTSPRTIALLMLAGPVTTVPFLFFGFAVQRLRLSTVGILQYLTPSLQFLLAVMVFGEPFSTAQLASFACVWAAVAIYAADTYRAARKVQLDPIE